MGHTPWDEQAQAYDFGTFIEGPDENGDVWACQYVDTDDTTAAEYLNLDVGSRNQGLWLDTITGWMAFLNNVRKLRTMFLAAQYPIACWHGTEISGYHQAQQRQYRLETYFHALLHGENRRFWYNSRGGGTTPPIDEKTQRDTERQTLLAMRELDIVYPYKEVAPLSLNYQEGDSISLQYADHVVSGASIPGNKRLFRVTLKDEQLVDTNGDRLFDKVIGPIGNGAEHVDFRTITGRVVRVPGQLVPTSRFAEIAGSEEFCEFLYLPDDDVPPDCETHEGSWFTDFGWWGERESV